MRRLHPRTTLNFEELQYQRYDRWAL